MKRWKFYTRYYVCPIATFSLVASLGGYCIYNSLIKDGLAEKKYNDLSNQVTTESTVEIPEETATEEIVIVEPTIEEEVPKVSSELLDSGYEFKNIDFDSLNEINPEVTGWITLDDTNIDYPIVQTDNEDSSYYLHHDLDGNDSVPGTIFSDKYAISINDISNSENNIIPIYGHHMKNGSMFTTIDKYKSQSFMDEHPYAVAYNEIGEAYKLEFFASVIISGEDPTLLYADISDEAKFNNYIDYVYANSEAKNTNIDVQFGDNIVTLVTCDYSDNNSRLLLLARPVKQLTKQIELESNSLSY